MFDNALVVSDCHIRHDAEESSAGLIKLLESRKTSLLILLGDTFDFYFDYKGYIPRGFYSVIEKIKDFSKKSRVMVFRGNHDMWFNEHFKEITGAEISMQTSLIKICGKHYLFSHGDEFCFKSPSRKFFDKLLESKKAAFMFSLLPPEAGYFIGKRISEATEKGKFRDKRQEMAKNSKRNELFKSADFVILGHSHNSGTSEDGKIIFLADFQNKKEYAYIDCAGVRIEHF
ncbi:MAG: metallophosphoesterase [bacterium]|nr:metallophosphoesterase [bacterium]